MGANNSTSLDETLQDLQETSRRAKLWVFYHQLVQDFIFAHDWHRHLNAVDIFAAAGHAKFGRLYLQEIPSKNPSHDPSRLSLIWQDYPTYMDNCMQNRLA